MQEPEKVYPKRLCHDVPQWVCDGALFHIRLRIESGSMPKLTEPFLATKLIAAAQYYHEHLRWSCRLFLLMPDHIHALLVFPIDPGMSRGVGEWKRYTARTLGIRWQENFFDHRLRDEGESTKTYAYILQNPVVKGLCSCEADWPWQWHSEDNFVWNPPSG
jgi:REP element-mobilizing transposase RayT